MNHILDAMQWRYATKVFDAHEEIDACPMEGFDALAFDDILDLKEKGLGRCVIAPVGFRSEKDQVAQLKKVRFPKDEVILKIR